MAVTKRTVQLQGLSDITTYITDTENRYFNITDIPEELSTGRSSFKLLGSPFLRENVVLKMELVDFKGRPIYMEPVFNYVEGQGIRVSIEVYDDVPEGTAELTILGEIDPTKVDFEIPPQFVDVYNVKYTKIISINKEIINSRPIRFFKRPKAVISEIIKGQVTSTASTTGSNNQSLGTVLGVPAVGTEGNTFVTDSAAYNEIPSYTDEQFGFSPFGNYDVQKITSPKYTFTVDGADFSSSMVGGTISITDPQANLGFNPSGEFSTPKYSARISRVINKKTIEVQKPFGIYDSGSNAFKISALNSSTYNVNWPKPTEFDSSSINFRSFADVQLYDVRTFSGDVYRIAGYVKNNGPFSNWQKVIDTPIESPELLIDPTSITGTTRLGYYSGDDIFTKYWNAFSGDFNSGPTGAGAITLQTYSADQYLNDSLFISGSVSIDLLDGNEDTGIVLQLKPQYSMSFVEGVAYSISGRAVVNNIGGSSNTAKAVFHLSGSAFGDSNKYDGFGRAIAAVTVENAANKLSRVENPYFEKVFVADSTGTAMLHVRFDSGIWELSELSIRPAADTNFSPEFIRLNSVLPPLQKRPDNLDFAFEFYNANNEKSTTVITTLPDFPDGVQFEGENINILGNDNVVGGSLFLGGDTTSSGIHFGGIESKLPETGNDGATASGFIRSVQYQGFTSASANNSHTGFMIYSGSVLPNSGDNYSGVGLELVGASGSLRFGTVPSRFEVIADSFFVGNSGSQFISGSGGIIEISSSAFHLSASGDVIISGSVTATEGNIGNWKIVDGKLSGSNATLDADGSALFMSTKGPDTNPNDGFYIDFTPTGHYVRFGTNFAVSSSGQLIASGAVIEGVLTASEGFIADWTIGSNTIHKPTGGTFTGLSSTGDTRFFAAATSLQNSGSAPFNVKTTGDITGSKVLFTGGKIGGFELTDQVLRNSNNTVELSSTLPGLAIKDPGGANRVLVKSGSLSTVGGATNRVGNNSFELDSISAGRNFVSSITSWSFTEHGATNISLTDRSNYSNANKAVTGDVTLDVVVPAGSGNYSTANNYKLIHVVTGSFVAGDTLSFSSVARFSSSFGGVGKDRALAPQYFRVEYSGSGTSGQFVPFLPEAQFTASNGYGEYFLGSGQYSSFGASGDLPGAADYVRVVLSGSINDDTGFTVEKPLFAGAKGDVAEELKVKKLAVEVKGSTTAEYPETELTFDNFSLKSNTRRVEVTQDGLLIYNSEDSFIKMTGAGIEIRGGSGVANFGTSVNRESFTNDSQVAGTLGAPALQPYTSNPNDISTTASPGNVGEFARGNHQHRLEFSTVNTLIGQNTVTGLSAISASITALTSSAISASGTGSFGAILVNGNPVVGATVGGSDTQVQFNDGGSFGAVAGLTFNKTTSKLSATGGVSGSATSTGSFGRIDASNLTGTNTGDVTLAGSRDYITISNQVITRNQIDIGDDTNLAVGTGLNLTGDTVSVDFTDSDLRSHISGSYKGDGVFSGSVQITHDDTTGFVANEHIDHSSVSITAGSGLTGGGSITTTRALNVGQGTGITVNATNITTNDSQIVHDNLSGFVANEHIDHSGVTLSAGTGLTGGGDITTNRSFSIDFTDSDLKSHVSGSYKGDGVFSGSVQITHDDTTGFVANEHIDHTGVTITAGAGLTGGGTIASSRTINAVAGTGISVNADNITTNDSEIVHDNLSGFVANEHIDHSGVSVVAGAGLTGGGTIVSNRTINVVGGTGITANADDIATNDSEIVHDDLSGFVANEHIDHSGVSVTAGAGLTGGGTIAATRTINVVGGTGITANANDIATNDSEIVHDNLSGFVANEHIDHTSVSITAGTGLSGGGDISGTRTLAVDFTDSTFKANVTGSSTALSASLSGRITTEASNVDSLQAASASFSTRVTSNKTKLDTIETNADVTDTANVTSAGALMDSELTSISDVKALNQSVISGASPTFGTANFTDASDKRLMTDAQETKLDSVESSADVTDTANVTSAGALMDSELTSISDVKALDQSVISGASPTFGTANLTDATNKRLMTDAQETKLDSVESSADVTDTANVTSAGALMDSEVTNLSLVKGLTSGISNGNVLVANSVVADNDFLKIDGTSVEGRTAAEVRSDLGVESGATADQSDAEIRAAVEAATDSNVFTDADHTKLNAIEASADVTDTANVTAAGALMDSEVDADIKTLVLPASTTISAFGRTLIDDAAASNARTTLGLGSISTLSSIDISANTNLAASTGITLTGDTLTTNDGEIVHDDLSGFVANEHIDHSGVTLSAGTGLTGGGDITTNRSFAIDFTDSQFKANVSGSYKGDGVFSGSVQITHDDTTGFVANEHIDHTGVSIVAGAGLTGGGTIASSRTLNIGAGTGIDVAADAISVDVSDFLSNGSNDRVLTATGTDAMNAEANLIFDGTNLGIGQDTPTHMLDIYAGSLNAPGGIHLTNDDTGGGSTDGTTLFVEQNSTDFFIRNYENAGIRMRTNDTDALYINSSQNVGIGTTSPSQKLHVVGDTFIDGALTAREIYTDIVSSSIKYTSGSNKLGDSADDVHDVTGSFRVLGLASITDTTSNSTGILTITGNNAPSIKFNTPADDWLIGTHYAGSGHDFSVVNTTLSKKPFIIVNDTVGIGGDGSSNGTDPTGLGLIIDGSTATFSTTTNFGSNASTNMNIDSGDIASGVTINKSPVVNFNSGDVQGSITLTNLASGTGALTIQATSVEGSMLNDNVISGQGAMTGDVADADELMISDAGVLKRADFSVVRDAVFNDVSGDITIAAGGAATIAANSVALGTDTTGNYVSSLVAGTGIDLANNSGESATPTVSVDVSDFMSNGLNNRILTAAGADTMNAEENLTFDGSTLAIADGRSFSTSTFISGILGDGFRIDDSNNNSGSSLEIDNIVVRNTLRTHIFQKDVVKATNGILLVSDSGVISGSTGTTSTGTITVENDKSATFTSGQKAIFKEAGDDGSINFVQFTFTSNGTTSGVQSGFTKYNITANNGTLADLEPGGTFARISGGSVLIDASSPNSPFIDINYASGSTTARFGNLAGITSPRFGALGSNFGFWASGSAFLEGTINAKAGNIGTWGIGETAISSSGNNVIIDAATKRITINDGSNDRVHLGEVGSAYGLKIFDGTGTADGDRLVELGSGDNMIAGWDLKTDKIGKGPVSMSFADESFIVNAVNKNKVRMGNLNGKFGISSDQYGFILGDGSNDNSAGNVMVELSDRQNIIAGWELTPGTIQTNSTAGSVAISSTSQSFSIYTASIDYDRPKLVLGKLPLDDGTTDSPYGLAVFSGSQGEVTSGSLANASVVITKNIAKLAGWELVPGRLTSGTVAKIDGNNASIALGTNATTHTSATPQPNLFFVSASTNPVFFVGENFSFINNELKAAGWTIGSTSIAKSTDVVIDSNAKSITLGNGAVAIENNSGTPIIRSATNFTDGNGFFLSSAGTNNFRVGNNGAARLQFTGTNVEIYNSSNTKLVSLGASNTIASWTINSSTITGGSVTIDSAGIIRSATDFANGDGFFLSSASTNNFRVGDAGAARLQFTGTNTEIYNSSNQKLVSLGASNTIAGWTITTGAISKNDVKLDSTTNGEGLYVKKTSFSSNTAGGFLGLDSGVAKFNVGDASKFIKFDGSDLTVDAGNFSLDSSGNMTATSATLTGTVTATAGQIGGFGIAAGAISSSNNNLALSATHASMSLGNKIKVVGGTDSFIAGGEFFSGVGGDSVAGFDNDFEGFILGMDGNDSIFEISDGTVGENFIRFSTAGDGLLQLASSNIHLQSSGFSLSARSSTATTNKLSLGSITSTTDSSGKGFFADGGGNFRVIGDGSTTVEISGSGIDIKTNSFYFGDNSQFISGSGGVLQISSSAFHLNGGDVVMSGSVTAGSGDIGGWTIGASTLTGGNVTLDSGGSIKVGTLGDANRTDLTTKGFFADNDGNVLIKADDANNNFIKFDADATNPIEMKTTNFHLDTSGDITMTGDITATNITATTAGNLGGWSLSSAGLSKKQSGKQFSKYTSSFLNDNDEPRLQLDRLFQLPEPLMVDGGGERTQVLFKNADDAGAMTMSFKGANPYLTTANTPSNYIGNSDIGKRGSIEMYVGSSQRSSSAAYNSGNGRDPGGGVNAFKSFFGGASLGVRVNYRDNLGPTNYDVNDYMGMTATVADMTTNHGSLKGRGAFFYASKYSGSWMYMGSGSLPTEMADFRIPHDRHPGGLSGDRNYGIALWSGSYFHMTGSAGNPPTASIHGHLTLAGGDYAYGRRGNFNSSLAQATDGVQFGSGSTLNIVAQNSNGMHEPYMTFIKPGTSGIGLHTLAHVTGSNTKLVMRTMNFAHPYRDLMTWDASGARVGILDTSPSYTLDVGGTINASEIRINGSVVTTGGLGNVSEDTSPQLGGDLDLNGDDITGTGNINITGTGTFSSTLVANGDFTVDTDLLFADVSADKVSITGTGTNKVTNKTLQINFNNASAEPHTGNNIGGGGAGDGVLIENHNTTNNSYANLDFRADAADGRIALQRKGTNIGDFVFINDNSGIHETLRITAAGDLHLNENVLFDSSARVIAGKTRMFITFGRNSTISTTGTTTFEGFGTNGTANGEGYRMIRAGEITGVSTHYDIINAGGSGSTCKVQVTKNAIDVTNANVTHTFVAGGDGTHTTFAAGTHTFSAGDRIGADLILSAVSSTVSLDDCTIVVEITC